MPMRHVHDCLQGRRVNGVLIPEAILARARRALEAHRQRARCEDHAAALQGALESLLAAMGELEK